MYYHATAYTGPTLHYWSNTSFDQLADLVLIPFVNQHVVAATRGGGPTMLNFAAVEHLKVYKTESRIPEEQFTTDVKAGALEESNCTDEMISLVRASNAAEQTRSLLQLAFVPPQRQIFVVMKFGDMHLDSAYDGVIRPTIESHGYKALRIDEVQDSGRISDQILQAIAQSAAVFCDLSGERPNCYYEAGFAHALGKELVFTIKTGDKIHFDLAGYRFIEWDTEQQLRTELNKRFEAMIPRLNGHLTTG